MSAGNPVVIDRRGGLYLVWVALGDEEWKPGGSYLKRFTDESLAHAYAHRVCHEEVVEYGVRVLYDMAPTAGAEESDIVTEFGVFLFIIIFFSINAQNIERSRQVLRW